MVKGRQVQLFSPAFPPGTLTAASLTATSGTTSVTVAADAEEGSTVLSAALVPPAAGLYRLAWSANVDGSPVYVDDYAAATFVDVEQLVVGIRGMEDGTYDPAMLSAAVFISLGSLLVDVSTEDAPFGQADYNALPFMDAVRLDNGLAFLAAAYCGAFMQTVSSTGEIAQVGVAMDAVKYHRKYAQSDLTEQQSLIAQGMALVAQVPSLAQTNAWVEDFKVFQPAGARRRAREALGTTSTPMYSVWRDDRMVYDYGGVVNEFNRWVCG